MTFSRQILAAVAAICFVLCFIGFDCKAQTLSVQTSDNRVMRERIATIFNETFKQGESGVRHNVNRQVTTRTFVPPSTKSLDEIRRYGEAAIPILAEYLDSGSGFEKYLAMRFLGSIGGTAIFEPLSKVALKDASPSFRLVALLWLAEVPWDLAAPIVRQISENETSLEVCEKAKEMLAQHAPR